MGKFCLLLVVLLCLSTQSCGDKVTKLSNGSLSFSTIPEVKVSSTLTKSFDGKGLEPWYDVAKSFIHTVQKDDLPYDDIEKAEEGHFEAEEFLKGWELRFLVVFAIGILFAIIFPIVGFCFCCCRCCGKCGGEMVQKQSDKAACKRSVFGVVLSIITILMFAGCLMAFVSNDRITDTVESLKTTPIQAIRDIEQYFNQSITVVSDYLIASVVDGLQMILDDVIKLPGTIGSQVKNELSSSVQSPLESVIKLGNETKRMGELLREIKSVTAELKTNFSALSGRLDEVNKDLKSKQQNTTITTGANFTTLPSVTQQLNNINGINNKNLTENAVKGLEQFNDITDRIERETKPTVDKIRNKTRDSIDEFQNKTQKDIVDEVNKLILDKTNDWVKDIEDMFEDHIKPYDRYRYSVGVGLTCVLLLPVVLMAVGLLCGTFGHDKDAGPTDRGTISNMGGNCLMAAVGFMFIFVFFLMLFTAICFILGANLEKTCYSLREETLFTDFLDNPKYWDGDYFLAKEIYNDGSIVLKISTILSECRKNAPIYQAMQGQNKWNLTEKFSVEDKLGNFEDDLNEFSVNVSDQNVLNAETKSGLEDLGKSGVDDINFETFFNETSKDVVNITEIEELQERLNRTEETRNISNDLDGIKQQAELMDDAAAQLKQRVQELKDIGGNISHLANDTLSKAEKAEGEFKRVVNVNIGDIVSKETKVILRYTDQISNWAINSVANDLGRCEILTDVYDAAINLLCRETVYPFNGYWFSVGFCLFFYIPAIILCVKLAKHYRRMRFEEGFDKHNTVEMSHMGERNKVWVKPGNAVYPK